jgi:hypothetical protein
VPIGVNLVSNYFIKPGKLLSEVFPDIFHRIIENRYSIAVSRLSSLACLGEA